MKQVRETAAGGKISAYVVLNKKGTHVATVNVHHGDSVSVDVFNTHMSKSYDVELGGPQQGKAGGYGYDKFAAAMSGMVIDGITLTDHCGKDEASEKLMASYRRWCVKNPGNCRDEQWRRKADKIGASFANWDHELGRYTSLHVNAGLDRLSKMGYNVIQAI